MEHSSLQHPSAIVTGASRGIGKAVAKRLAAHGYGVIVNYFRNCDAADATVSEIVSAGGQAVAIQSDIGDPGAPQTLTRAALEHFGPPSVLINNAGITSQGRLDILEASVESWDRVFDTNLKGAFFCAQATANLMIEHGVKPGYIINVNSISSYAVSTNRADYCIAKSGMHMMTKLFATRLADENVLVYEVCPGVIESDMTAPVKQKYDSLIEDGLSPIRRWGTGDDVAGAVSMLVSGALPFTTGERINIDGGFHIRRL
tara:strand:- start:864 stop:1640 length:777 start_codon:yes stop_codon:yes gene_type:complete